MLAAIKPKIEQVPISKLILDETVQLRANLNRAAILDYAESMKNGETFPPIVVFCSDGKWWVGDGFHRVLAAKHNKSKTISAECRPGTRRDAILWSARANVKHGIRRTNEDKRKAVITFLKDKEWVTWTDSAIAGACGVSSDTVAKYRDWLRPEKVSNHEEVRTYIDRQGRERTRTVPLPKSDMGAKVRLRKCPYCGQDMRGSPRIP